MGIQLSKPLVDSIPFGCYEIGHTWTPHCNVAQTKAFFTCLEEGIKIYSSVYIFSTLLSGKIPDVKKTLTNIIQSSLFLSTNGSMFIVFYCLCRKLAGSFGVLNAAFLPAFLASFVAILVEKPSRRTPLAIYVTNVASETVYNMLIGRGVIKPLPYGHVLIFALTMAGLSRWYRTTNNKNNLQYKLMRVLVGDAELKPPAPPTPGSHGVLHAKHALCPHKQGCIKYSLQVLIRRFVYGWGLHAGLAAVISLPLLFRKPSKYWPVFTQGKHVKFGALLALISGLYRAVHCALRWIRGTNSPNHSILAGLVAGTSIAFYQNSSLMLYVAWKTIETLYCEGMDLGVLPDVPGFNLLLYSFSTGLLFHAAVLESHHLKPSYWKFLMRITGNGIAEMNRHAMDVLGTRSSKLIPNFQPNYDPSFLSDAFKKWLALP